ncbi:EF-hand calcium-binding domain-containing protein 7-like isoform X14 [Ruditapes philippinarum]|uniref:EF-hand calcium-binding domain-containing protein 7-like isoform X14 n=1 Tax=Ruditapes philippinarum TaxID=129788 RepID=UPI00295BF477|nr:EF-hand calcium-binding domain-containing protein 7-like isoform X14 [Ruditapes philippinarum]
MSSSRRSSRQSDTGSEIFLECKAAFLSIYDDINDKIESKKRLNNVLQQSGRNPTKAALNKYWTKDTEELSFNDFVDICRKEPVTTADDLMKAFRKIDINGDGYISLDELYKIMNAQGESMSRDDVKKMIDEVDENKDGRLDYGEFTNMIMKTTEDSKKFSMKVMEKKERKKRRAEKSHNSAPESPKKDSPKASPRSRSDSLPKSGVKKATPREQTMKDSGAKETPRRELSARHDKPPLPDSPKTKDSSTDKAKASKHEKLETPKTGAEKNHISFKLNLPLDSARSVGEEIDFDDDFDIVSTGRPTPRIDLNATAAKSPKKESKEEAKLKDEEKPKSDDKKEKDVKESARDVKDENGLGSQASIRSGDKEISAPVPSPRKSVSRLSEDDVPRPSPRVKGSKGKSPSTKSRDKMPDPKSLQDWMHYTSKGCFFYEEEEIVSHIYSLKLTEDSSVYLSAHPIQEPACLDLPGTEPIDTALYIFDSRGKFVTCTENRDTKGTYGVKCELSVGEYQVLPYTTGCRFKPRSEALQEKMKESKLVKTKDDKVVITAAFRRALEEIFDLCDLDDNGTMSKDEFNWFNLRTSGEELGEDEWEVVEEKTALENGEITKQGFIELNEMEAEDSQGDVEDLWITLTSMGMNKALIMDEACPYRIDVYVEESGRKKPSFKVTGIESLDKREFVSEICQYIIERAEEPTKIRNMKDLYMYTDKTDLKATIVIDNKSRSNVSLQVNCSRSKNVVSNRPSLDHTVELEPQSMAIAHHLLPKNELSDWSVACTENILK